MTLTLVSSRDDVRAMVRNIAMDVQHNWRPSIIAPILNGALRFGGDLHSDLFYRGIDVPVHPIRIRRDAKGKALPGFIRDLEELHDHHVLIVDTIYDSGRTIAEVERVLPSLVKSLAYAFLFVRGFDPPKLSGPVFVGKQLKDNYDYLVGYGMDANGYGRGQDPVYSQPPSAAIPQSGLVREKDQAR